MRASPGVRDLIDGLKLWRLWMRMGWMDIIRRYRRTKIGPFWGTLSTAAFIGTMGFLYAGIFKQDPQSYLPYLSSGFTVWIPLASMITESSATFVAAEGIIKQSNVPFTAFVWAALVRNIIVFLHNVQVFIFIAIIFRVEVNINTLLIFPAIILLSINAIWIGSVISILCTRFRDLQQLLTTIVQMTFFLTPIFWTPGQVGRVKTVFVDFNPVFHFLDILRSPMLGKAPDMLSWYVVFGITIAGWTFAILCFNRYRHRIILWM